jgi:putative transposase
MNALVNTHSLYRRLGQEDGARQSAYRALVKAPLDAQIIEEIRARTNKGWALGSGRFQSKVERLTERRTAPLPRGRQKSSG